MKTAKWSFSALAIAVAACAAFAFQPSQAKTAVEDEAIYILEDNQTIEFTGTRAQASTFFGCPVVLNPICAKAYVVGHAGDPAYRLPALDVYKP
ncbi:hypothetical protein EGT74_00330 [Chitinophaga lutea]|uniref:Uncharacterized protein n=1 Tax=Chitinophaga lutea TaxID=2488634 RepID=A0A3N4PVY9_9BACT|nr:hypothetical protein [Chitinophaga lutea]RPE12038.1 hypothetical protein EGT74_00330 [Chitinophaga lutea]